MKKIAKTILIILFGFTIVVLAAYFFFTFLFMERFFFRTTINGMPVSGMSVEAVKEAVATAALNYSLDITRDGKVVDRVKGTDIDLVASPESGEIEAFLSTQDPFLWPKSLFEDTAFKASRLVVYSVYKLNNVSRDLSCVNDSSLSKSEDATYEFNGEAYAIVPEVYGTEVDSYQLAEGLKPHLFALEPSVDIDKNDLCKKPGVTVESRFLQDTVELLNSSISMKIEFEEGETIDSSILVDWISLNGKNVVLDEAKVREYVESMAKKYNTYGKPKNLITSWGDEVEVPGGNYGWKMDVDAEVAHLISDIMAGEDVSREMEYTYRANSHGENDYGDSYVEVNLTKQHLYLYVDGEQILDSPFVSGDLSKARGTHTGAYKIAYCQRNAVLRGPGYASPVKYWMPFNGGEGLHDANWRYSFGGQIFKTNGSHGCINLPIPKAEIIFSHVKAGFPVLVYSQGGTDNYPQVAVTKTPAEKAFDVSQLILAIGDVTLESEAAITAARTAYNALEKDTAALVTGYEILLAAESKLNQLKSGAPVTPQPQPEPQPEPEPQPGEGGEPEGTETPTETPTETGAES